MGTLGFCVLVCGFGCRRGPIPRPISRLVFRSMGTSTPSSDLLDRSTMGTLGLVWRRSPLNYLLDFLWRTRLWPHPLTPRVVSDGGLLMGVAGLRSVVVGAGEGLLLVVLYARRCVCCRARDLLMARRMFDVPPAGGGIAGDAALPRSRGRCPYTARGL